jgi:hypothetical protein
MGTNISEKRLASTLKMEAKFASEMFINIMLHGVISQKTVVVTLPLTTPHLSRMIHINTLVSLPGECVLAVL